MRHGIDAFEPGIYLILKMAVNDQPRPALSLVGRGNANGTANRNPSGKRSSLDDRANACAHRVNGHGGCLNERLPQSASDCGVRMSENVHDARLGEHHCGYENGRHPFARVNANGHPCNLNASRKAAVNENENARGLPRVHGRNDHRTENVSVHESANDRPMHENVSDVPKVRGLCLHGDGAHP